MAADALGVRMAHLEGAYERIDKRLGSVEERLGAVEREVRALRTELLARMDRQFFWVLGLLIVSIFSPFAGRIIGH